MHSVIKTFDNFSCKLKIFLILASFFVYSVVGYLLASVGGVTAKAYVSGCMIIFGLVGAIMRLFEGIGTGEERWPNIGFIIFSFFVFVAGLLGIK